MFRKLFLAVVLVGTFAAVSSVADTSGAELFVRRPRYGTYFYYNGPPQAFYGPPIRIHSSAWDIGPYGPGYGWAYRRPLGFRVDVGH